MSTNDGTDDSKMVFTWSGISIHITFRIRALIKDVSAKSKDAYLPGTAQIVQAVHIMFHVSGTSDNESHVLAANDGLRKSHTQILNWLSKLILAAKLGSTVWPPPDADVQLSNAALELLQAVRQFTSDASQANLPIVQLSASELASFSALSVSEQGKRRKNDAELVSKLESRMVDILTLVSAVNIVHQPSEDGTHTTATTEMTVPQLISNIQALVGNVGNFISIIDHLPLDSLFEDLTIDFKVNRLTLLNSITELVMAAKKLPGHSNALDRAPDMDTALVSIELVVKASKELLISTKFLIEEKETMEQNTLASFIHNLGAPPEAYHSLSRAASLSFQERDSTLKPESTQPRVSLLPPRSGRTSVFSGSDSNALSPTDETGGSASALFAKYQQQPSLEQEHQDEDALLGLDYEREDMAFNKPNGQLLGGTLKALVAKLTDHRTIDDDFNSTFLLTYRTVCTTTEFLALVINRFSLSPPAELSEEKLAIWTDRKLKPIRLRVYMILKLWLESYVHDDTHDQAALSTIAEFADSTMKQHLSVSYTSILRLVEKRRVGGLKPFRTSMPAKQDLAPAPLLPRSLTKLKLYELEPVEVARQLTLLEYSYFQAIESQDLVSKVWGASDILVSSIDKVAVTSSQITTWVVHSILQVQDGKKRARAIGFFTAIANVCISLHNYNTVHSILVAFASEPLARLHKTWDLLNQKYSTILATIRTLMSSDNDFLNYRSALKRATSPCVPILDQLINDLYHIKTTMPINMKRAPALLNFERMVRTAQVLKMAHGFSTAHYALKGVVELRGFLLDELSKPVAAATLMNLSSALEGG
ncbi:hypothetical protein HDU91_000642, partial [Kappamyces sp. JEL0680]